MRSPASTGRFAPHLITATILFPALGLVLGSTAAFAHSDPVDNEISAVVGSQVSSNTLEPASEHVDIDIAPTLAEEAALLERVERERLGVNPRNDAVRPESGARPPLVVSADTDEQGTADDDPVNESATDPAQLGRWEPLQDWPVIGVFASLLPDGRVLTFDSVGDEPASSSDDHTFTRAAIWDPLTDTHVRVDTDTGYNLFCAGFATLEDGRLFLAGGNANAALDGLVETHTFNPVSDTWALGQRMDYPRWYPAVTPLADGDLLISGGGFAVSEVREVDGAIRQLSTAASNVWNNRNYPWLQLAPDGRVAFLGPATRLGYVDTDGTGAFQATVQREPSVRNYGSYALYDIGKVMVAGGGFQSSFTDQRATHPIDLGDDSVTPSGSMNNRRRQHNLTVLADGSVLATGGFASNEGLIDLQASVFEAELWNPLTGQWQALAEEDRARQYHSSALLLPDGRVLSAGGGICAECQRDGYLQKNGQVFTPPYLFNQDGSGSLADRPVIASVPAELGLDQPFVVTSTEAAEISKVAMVRTGSVTHSQNMEQRYIPLSFSISENELTVQSPGNSDIAPPGHYLLFIIDQNGVPSVAKIVNLRSQIALPVLAVDAVNVAAAGIATQSSTRTGADAFLAIDGNSDGDLVNGSVAQTEVELQPWWELDLGDVLPVQQIVINGRSDCCTDALSNFHVLVSATPFTSGVLANTLAQPSISDFHVSGSALELLLDVERPARYIRIQLAGQNALELAEVQVLVDSMGHDGVCGSPRVDPAVDAGVHVWKECDGGPWSLMLTGPADTGSVRARGKITSVLGLASVTPRSLESSDKLTSVDPLRTDFNLTTGNPWNDRFEFTVQAGDSLCLGLDEITSGQQLHIGPYRIPAGAGPVDPVSLQSCEFSGPDCSAPVVDPSNDKALVTWVDCDGVLHLLGAGALDFARYSGHVYASTAFTDVATRSFESSDTLVSLSDADIYFNMGMGGGYTDELLLTSAGDTDLCVEINSASGDTLLLAGSDRTLVTSPFNPRTLAPCVPPSGGSDCGSPTIDTAIDSALFIWKNCDGIWSVLLTGERDGGGVASVVGSIDSSEGFLSVSPKGLESSDSLSTSLTLPLEFAMKTINPWRDDFDFAVQSGASLCVNITNIDSGVDILAGPDRTPVGTSFNPETYAACP